MEYEVEGTSPRGSIVAALTQDDDLSRL